jgi:hypothetical protein
MPYKEGKRWRATFDRHGMRKTKLFHSKEDAVAWENKQRIEHRHFADKKEKLRKSSTDLDELRANVKHLLSSPECTIADIFDYIMREVNLDYSFSKHVLQIARNYIENKFKKVPASTRLSVLRRDNYVCQICGASGVGVRLHVDHIVPRSRGGVDEERNLRTLCADCNLGKGGDGIPLGNARSNTHCNMQIG